MLLSYVENSERRKSAVEKDADFEAAEKKLREAQIAFYNLSEQQRNMVHFTIQDTQVAAVTVQFPTSSRGAARVTTNDTTWPRPEAFISGIVTAFAILTGKNPRPLPKGEGITKDYSLRMFMLDLLKLVESCGGKLYPNAHVAHGGRRFKAVVDILKAYYPDFIPDKLPRKSIEADWLKDKKSRHP